MRLLAGDMLDRMAAERIRGLWLVPGSVPIYRRGKEILPFGNTKLFPDDIRQILMNLRSRASLQLGSGLGESGCFSFGVKGVGRFRVSYVMQRGSYAVFIFLTGEEPFSLDSMITDFTALESLRRMMASSDGIIIISGPFTVINYDFAGAIVAELVANRQSIVYTVEDPLIYTLRHRKSVVIQCEVGTDVKSVKEGIVNAVNISADVLYVSNIPDSESLEVLLRAIEGGRLIIVSFVSVGVIPGLFGLETMAANRWYFRQKLAYALLGSFSPRMEVNESVIEWLEVTKEMQDIIMRGAYEELEPYLKISGANLKV